MKLGIFTDPHYSSQEVTCEKRYNSRSLEKIKQAYRFFEEAQCDLVICLGDLTDHEDSHEQEIANLRLAAAVIHASPVKTVCLMGNHDAFSFTVEEFYRVLGGCRPVQIEAEGKTLLFADACHFKSGAHYQPGDSDWTDTAFPHVDELRQALDAACGSVYVFLHQNIDPEIPKDHCLFNAAEINDLLRQSGKVKAVFQGHYHPGRQSERNGICYRTFPAMCENENAYFTEEI